MTLFKKNINMKEKVIIYTRVSTDEQADKGFSLRHQKEMLERYCELKDYALLKHFEEDFSAKNFNRPEWIKLEAFVKANRRSIDKIIFTKWDRFSRNIEEALRVIRNFRNWGIEVNAIEQPLDLTNPDNKTMLALYLVMPEVENDKISQRTKDGIIRARKEGAYTAKPPFGYSGIRIDNKASLVPNEDAEIVKNMFKEVANGVLPIEHIRKSFIKQGYKGCKQSFYYMLRNKLYTGHVMVPEYKKHPAYWVEGLHEAIVDEATFSKVQEVLESKKKIARYPTRKNDLLPLRGHLKCAICGENMTGSISKGNGGKYPYYHCRKGCKNRLKVDEAHSLFGNNILSPIIVNDNVLSLFEDVLKDSFKNKRGDKASLLDTLSKEIYDVGEQIIRIEDKFAQGGIDDESFNRMNNRFRERIMSLKAEYELIKSQKEDGSEFITGAIHALGNLGHLFENGSYEIKSLLLGSILDGKLIISKDECRTTEMNQVVELMTRFNEGFQGNKKEKAIISDGLSNEAPRVGLEPTTP